MERLRRARVVVAGLGAVGSYAVEGLARAGVGHLRLVDFDTIHPTNINRQLYALHSTLGRSKTEVAAERVRDINPACDIEALNLFIESSTLDRVLAGEPDALIDAIDSLSPKVALLTAAARAGLFVVSSMGAATRTDPMAVRVGDLSETERCPLARWIRKRLGRSGIRSGIRCVYSVEPPRRSRDATPEHSEERSLRRGRDRAPLGSLSVLTGLFGLIAAREAIFHIIRNGRAPDERAGENTKFPRAGYPKENCGR